MLGDELYPSPDNVPVPVAVVVDETKALEEAERTRRYHTRLGAAVVAAALAPVLGLVCRILWAWFDVGWSAF